MHLIGAAAVMLASFGIGCLSVFQMQKRLRLLRDFRDGLVFMEGELAVRQPTLPELIDMAVPFSAGEAGVFFQTLTKSLSQLGEKNFCELWEEAVMRQLSLMPADAKREVLGLGKVLGRTSVSRQLDALENCSRILSALLTREEQQYRKERKMRIVLPSSFGVILIILLL